MDSPDHARFYGHLDTTTLKGAGFASQHSLGELHLDLADYDGIVVSIRGPDKADGKRYALTLKDALVPPSPDGKEQSSLSWEAQFVAEKPGDVKLPWSQFQPTNRGREVEAPPLNLKDIKRVGLMMRRYVEDTVSAVVPRVTLWTGASLSTSMLTRHQFLRTTRRRLSAASLLHCRLQACSLCR